jgi:PAS domain S-box-containing protein
VTQPGSLLLARFSLRRQFQALIAAGAVLAVLAVVALASAVRQARQLEATHMAAVEMAREMTGLLVLTQEYLLYGEPRAREQWEARYRRLQDAHAAAQGDAAVPMPGVPQLFRPEQLQLLPTLFGELRREAAAGGDAVLSARRRELAVDRLLATGQALAENAYDRERAISERRNRSEKRMMALALAGTGALGLLCVGLGALIARRVLSPLRRLQAAIGAASGAAPSATAAPQASADELGALADRMEGLGQELARRGQALAEREALLRLVVDHVPAMIGYWDREGRNRLANADYRRWFGKAPAEIEGRSIAELLGPELYMKNRPFIERALAGERQEFERSIPGPDGVTRHSHAVYVPDLRDGRVQGFVALVTDVTRRVKDEQALARALAERETLLKEVYHRVKNNLQVVLSLLRLQGRGLVDEAARAALADAAERVRAMALVHEQLMDSPDGSHVPLARYVPGLLSQLAAGHGCDSTGPVQLVADVADTLMRLDDAVPLGLLLTELVVNSLKHGFPDGRAGSVTVRIQPNEDGLFVAVIDDGCGLPLAPVDGRPTLGRQLAAGLAAQLGGELHHEATPGGGTTAWLLIPFRA